MKKAFALGTLAILFAILAGTLWADVLHLANGGTIEGIVKDKGDNYEVQTTMGSCTIPKDQVLLIECKECVLEKYAKAAANVKADDAQGHYDLAMLCKEGKWTGKMRDELVKAIEINPDHELARAELGYVKYEGKWVTRDEMMQARGYARFEGKWVSPDYMRQIDVWKKSVQTVKKQEGKMNKALARMALRAEKYREAGFVEFVKTAAEAGVTNAEEVGKQIKDYYGECWRVVAEVEKQNALTEVRATNGRLVELQGVSTFVGRGGGESVVRRIELPVFNVTSVKTTVLAPAGVRVTLWYPQRPEFQEE